REHVEIITRHRDSTPYWQVRRSSGCHNMALACKLRQQVSAMVRGDRLLTIISHCPIEARPAFRRPRPLRILGDHRMEPDPITAPAAGGALPAVPQAAGAALTRAAIFLVVTVNPDPEARVAVRSLCADLAALLRAVGFREPRQNLSCIMGFGS